MRLDQALVIRSLARSRSQAAQLIADGRVRVAGETSTKASRQVSDEDLITAETEPWASRASHKLLGALADSGTVLWGRVLDAGASTGGFTQVALHQGAARVYAVDVGHGQLVESLRGDPRVVVREGLNLRHLKISDLEDQPVDFIVGDVSFISLRLLLAPLLAVLTPRGQALLLVKPQFEVGRERVGAGGVVREAGLRRAAVDAVVADAQALGWRCDWRAPSHLPGSMGNQEFFIRLCADSGS